MAEPLKLNLGCGQFPLAGYVNIDQHYPDKADVVGDFLQMKYEEADEIAMLHVLEHFHWTETIDILTKLRGWLKFGGKLVVEVPDCEVLLALGTGYPTWQQAIYGAGGPGEEHKAGFTAFHLVTVLTKSGFKVSLTELRRFASEHPARKAMPCIEATAFR